MYTSSVKIFHWKAYQGYFHAFYIVATTVATKYASPIKMFQALLSNYNDTYFECNRNKF
jgi:hypothetical protein